MSAKTNKLFTLFSAFSAFAVWGGWTYYINSGHDDKTRIISALTQGIASFIVTYVMVKMVSWVYDQSPSGKPSLFLPPIATIAFTGICLALIHMLVGTPKILMTIAPTLVFGFVFCSFTTYKLHTGNRN